MKHKPLLFKNSKCPVTRDASPQPADPDIKYEPVERTLIPLELGLKPRDAKGDVMEFDMSSIMINCVERKVQRAVVVRPAGKKASLMIVFERV